MCQFHVSQMFALPGKRYLMSPIGYWHVPLVGLLCLGGLAPAQAARPSLAEAVKKVDSKYLNAPETGPVDKSPKIEVGGSEEGSRPGATEISSGPLRVTVTYVEEPQSDEMQPLRTPVVTVYLNDANAKADKGQTEGGRQTADTTSPAGSRVVAKLESDGLLSDQPLSVQIAELDPSNHYPEVVVSFFTGGAHCCSDTSVVTSSSDGAAWETVDVGEFDGGPKLADDLDGDGVYEFGLRDNAFLYAFGCYACSEAPLQVLALKGGEVEDVSTEARFRPAHAAWLREMIEFVPDDEPNGFLAGYVGEKIRLGEGKEAWDLMLKYYDHTSDWGLDICNRELNENGDCPGRAVKVTFPEALERMLNESGYKIGD